MKLKVDINASPISSATAGIEFGSQFFWKDTVNLQIDFLDVDVAPTWAGTATIKVNLTDDENYPLIDTQTLAWNGTTAEGLVALNDFRIDTYLDGVEQLPCILEVQVQNNTEKQTVVKQQFQLLNTFMEGFDVELTEPLEPDLLEVEQSYPPAAPDQVSVIKFPENILEINAIIIDGNEQYTPYEPSSVVAILTNQCRPPLDVEAAVTPAAPDLLDADVQPAAPDQISAGELPEAPDLLSLAISPTAPSQLQTGIIPAQPDQLEAETKPLAPDQLATQQVTPAAPSMLNVGIDDFAASRYSPVLHVDISQETDTLVFDEYDAATDPSPATTDYDFKIDNLVGVCDGEALNDGHGHLWRLRGYYKKSTGHTHRDYATNLLGDAYYMVYPIKTDFSTWPDDTTNVGYTAVDQDWTQHVPFSEVPAFCYADGEWQVCRYNVVSNEYKNFAYNIHDDTCPTGAVTPPEDWTPVNDTKYPSEIPYADFTFGTLTQDLRPQSLTNYGNQAYQLTQTDYYKRGVLGLYKINNLNTLTVGNENIEMNPSLPATTMKLSYETDNPFEVEGTSTVDSTFGEVEMVFAMKTRIGASSIQDHMFIGNGSGPHNENSRFTAHIPWVRQSGEIDDAMVGHYFFDAGNGSTQRVAGLGDDDYTDAIIVSLTSSVTNDLIQLRVNGRLIQEKTGAIPINIGDTLKLPAAFDPQNVHIGEILCFRNIIGESRVERVEGYFGHKWDVARLFPDEHPWRWIKPYNADDLISDNYFPSPVSYRLAIEDLNDDGDYEAGFATRTISNNLIDLQKTDFDTWAYNNQLGYLSDGHFAPADLRTGDILYFGADYNETITTDVFDSIYSSRTIQDNMPTWAVNAGTYLRVVGFLYLSTNSSLKTHVKLEFADARGMEIYAQKFGNGNEDIPRDMIDLGAVLKVQYTGSYPSAFSNIKVVAPIASYDGTQTQSWLT